MNIPNINFSFFDQKLIHLLDSSFCSNGLSSGRMGYCIYFYQIGRLLNNPTYESIAEKILSSLLSDLKGQKTLDFSNGLSGIGLGINYLIKKKIVEGNVNQILRDIDDLIFIQLGYPQKSKELSPLHLIHLLIYLRIRLSDQKNYREQEFLFRELIIQGINTLYERINLSFFEEPATITIDYTLPLFLYFLGEIYQYNFYNRRIHEIVSEISPKVLSSIPTLHSNRLYLLWGMKALYKEIPFKDWANHISLISNTLDTSRILTEELRDRNIFFKDGLTGIYWLADHVKNCLPYQKISILKKSILEKIVHSDVWKMMNENRYFNGRTGLLDGYCGVSLLLQSTNCQYL